MDSRIAKNYLYTIAYKVLFIIAPLITTPYVSRVLHSDGVGIYSYTYSIATAFALVAALGINTYGQREIAYRQNNEDERVRTFDELFQLRLITTSIVVIAYFIFCYFYIGYKIPLLCQSAIILSTMFDISWYFQGIENFRIVVLRNLALKIVTIILIFMLVKTSDDVDKYILINSLSMISSNAVFFVNLKLPLFRYRISKEAARIHLIGALSFFVPLIAVEIYSHLDKIMLGAIVGSDFENGYYEQARKITQLIVTIIASINIVMLPRISNLYAQNKKEIIREYFVKSLNVIYLVMLPCVAGLFIISDQFVLWFFGDDFEKVSILLKICCFMIPFMSIGNFVGMQYLSPTNLQNYMTKAYVIAAVANIGMNIILIPRFASVGALIASAIAEMISCGIQVYYLQNSEFRFNMMKGISKYLIAASIMVLCLVIFNSLVSLSGGMYTIINMSIGAAIYIIVLVIVKEDYVWAVIKKLGIYKGTEV